uniref:(California timema) hypothetical protein n=1 Tax=Timema californicum TaxID=61474 RepID=A0A7R9JBP7_TIMCA|nr:unnamed protein product [Timema californicum]
MPISPYPSSFGLVFTNMYVLVRDRLPVEARPDAMHRIKTSVIICRRSGGNVRSCGKPWNERVEDVARIDGTTSHRLSLAS